MQLKMLSINKATVRNRYEKQSPDLQRQEKISTLFGGEGSGGHQGELGSSDGDDLTGTRNTVTQCPEGEGPVYLASHSTLLIQRCSHLKNSCLTNRKQGWEEGMVEDGV